MRACCLVAASILIAASASAGAADELIPRCRLDSEMARGVEGPLERAISTYKALDADLVIDKVLVNPKVRPRDPSVLSVFVVKDATFGSTNEKGCITGPVSATEELDPISVKSGCRVIEESGRWTLYCSADAVRIFGGKRDGSGANPALLYLVSHELGHVAQKARGFYSGRASKLDLTQSPSKKREALQADCGPRGTKLEEDADRRALEVLLRLLGERPYRHAVLNASGSMYWNIDQLAISADAWQNASLEREVISAQPMHPTFVPTSFPTPQAEVDARAKAFVCEALTKSDGEMIYPAWSSTHPPIQVRLQKLAEGLRAIAEQLPSSDDNGMFPEIAHVQSKVSPILAHIYRETGVYMDAVRKAICTRVNADSPAESCSPE